MAKGKNTKGQTTIYKTKDRVTRTPRKTDKAVFWTDLSLVLIEYVHISFTYKK